MYNNKFVLLVLFYFPLSSLALPNKEQFKCICLLSKSSPMIQVDILQSAIEHQTEQVVKRWLKELPNSNKVSPLLYAINNKASISVVAMILKYINLLKLDFYNIHNSEDLSIISIATLNKDTALIKLLLKNNVPLIWDATGFSSSPLHMAAHYNYLDIFKILVNYTHNILNIHSCDANNFTPVSYLIQNQQTNYVVSLLFNFPPSYTVAYIGINSYYNLAKRKKITSIMETLDNLFSNNSTTHENRNIYGFN